ncbi:MAG: c-type cytochrome [Verrucomicrobiales bacterium]|nr:c-type cytochrome [Verrucomicrobiales bacterium]MCP5557813.1 c-type cytochrome [Verrucomicrobiaceae bacterium]
MKNPSLSLITLGFLAGSGSTACAVDFKKDIQPILEKNCYECHSEKSGKKKGGFVFDDLETFKLDINPNGNAQITPGKPGESHLFEVVTDPNHERHMPPKGQLSDGDVKKLRDWIMAGASFDKAAAPSALPARKELPPIMSWTNSEGKTIRAGFVRLDGENVVLRMPANGQEVPYPLEKLNAESQAQAREAGAP